MPLPVTQPSCCAFGGPGGTTLFITSARKLLAASGELDGALLQVATGTRGAPTYRFRFD
ncbi:hypothetical protein SODG_007098 [Sodalis praecaptivus]|nr:SMP-30/gluconolactonase/LRE family protein [Sodalis praecaptivus]